jgi:hypothetical protein
VVFLLKPSCCGKSLVLNAPPRAEAEEIAFVANDTHKSSNNPGFKLTTSMQIVA